MNTLQTIFITRPISSRIVEALRAEGHTVVMRRAHTPPTKRALLQALRKDAYTVLVPFLTETVDDEVFAACPSLRLVANYTVGYNNIDLKAAAARNIVVTNTQGTSGRAVAETTVALIMAVLTRLVEGDRYVRAKKYKGWDPYLFLGNDLYQKSVGLIGVGEIGSYVVQMLIGGFGCRVQYSDIKRNESIDALGAIYTTKETILSTSDIISLHVPLLPETRHLICAESIAQMKKGAVVINTARGPVVDEQALVKALKNGTLAGAGLDVFEYEPHISKSLRKLSNVVLTPHIASARFSVREAMAEKVAAHIRALSAGEQLQNLAK